MYILGISSHYHDSAACLLEDGAIVAAASEERFTRIKHTPAFPEKAVEYCLREAGIDINHVEYIGFYDKPFIKFERILLTYLSTFPRSYIAFMKAMPQWMKEKLWMRHIIRKTLEYDREDGTIIFGEHHMSHAASSFFVSPFDSAAVMTIDGVGEWSTATLGHGKGNKIELIEEIRFPHSLGLLYSSFTYYLGFKVNSAEYKVMGLAPYGEPKYVDEVKKVIDIRDDGSFEMDMSYFAYHYGLRMTNRKFAKLFGEPRRDPESELTQKHKDIARSVQVVTEEIVLKMAQKLHDMTGEKNLCMAGGVALNCCANGRLLREGPFDEIFVQPAAGDAGGALGVASYIWHQLLDKPREFTLPHAFWGPSYSDTEIKKYLDDNKIPYHSPSRDELLKETAKLIDEQKVIGWFQGRMEFGPRALGARSIIADARNPENRDTVNLKIKFRESFRPFAPSVLAERADEYFDLRGHESPYMLFVADVKPDKRTIPSVTHIDGSARIQTVTREQNELYYDMIKAFDERTGCPVIINTSFNVRGEPIVCDPNDAYVCFRRTHMDHLVLGPYMLHKTEMPEFDEVGDWREEFELD